MPMSPFNQEHIDVAVAKAVRAQWKMTITILSAVVIMASGLYAFVLPRVLDDAAQRWKHDDLDMRNAILEYIGKDLVQIRADLSDLKLTTRDGLKEVKEGNERARAELTKRIDEVAVKVK